jgi:hypothetical protein
MPEPEIEDAEINLVAKAIGWESKGFLTRRGNPLK